MFNFTPLLGAQSASTASQSLLEFEGGIKVLVDVGWDSDFDPAKLKELERHVPTLSIILLTHATPSHIAAFAHCCKHFPLFSQIPVYATLPVISLGRTMIQDMYASTPLAASVVPASAFEGTGLSIAAATDTSPSADTDSSPQILLQPPSAEEIATYFSLINPLKYSQPHQPLPSPFSPPLNGLTVTAYNAGHSLGGTIWHVQHGMESVVYAVDWNMVRENVFSGAAWLGVGGRGAEVIEQLRKPTALVCGARGVEKKAPAAGGLGRRDELLLDTLAGALARGGTVLVPTDSSARVLELAYVLEHAWRKEAKGEGAAGGARQVFRGAKLFLAARAIGATMRHARSMLEWMDDGVVREFETAAANVVAGGGAAGGASGRGAQHRRTDSKGRALDEGAGAAGGQEAATAGPFDFRYLKLIERKSQVAKILSKPGPQVILASDLSVSWGFSTEVLTKIAPDPANLVVLTDEYALTADSDEPRKLPSIGQTLWKWFLAREDGVSVDKSPSGQTLEQIYTGGRELEYLAPSKTPLEGKELALYQQYLATQRQLLQNTIQPSGAAAQASADAIDDAASMSSSSSEESDDDQQGKALNYSTTLGHAKQNKAVGGATPAGGKAVLGINVLLKEPGVYDYDIRGKKGRESMFPYMTKRKRTDEFGELIRPEDYLRAEEREESDDELDKLGNSQRAALGQKRKWGESDLQLNGDGAGGRSSQTAAAKRKKTAAARSKKAGDAAANGAANEDDDDLSSESDFEPDTEAGSDPSAPAKLALTRRAVKAQLRIAHVPYEGLHDQRNLSMLIPLIQPRRVVLTGGSASETAWLARECRSKLRLPEDADSSGEGRSSSGSILAPRNGETVVASMDTNAWTVRLSNALVRKFRWQNVRGLSVVTLLGQLVPTPAAPAAAAKDEPGKGQAKKRVKLEDEEEMEDVDSPAPPPPTRPEPIPPTLDVLPAQLSAATRSTTSSQPLLVGDLRLADLRKMLQASGHSAEFRGPGTLVVDGVVAVRKGAQGGGRIEIEGSSLGGGMGVRGPRSGLGEGAFEAVKKRIYEGLAVIAGR